MRNFQDVFETRLQSFISAFSICMTVLLSKRNKKCEISYNNFALWKIETIVYVKHQKQPSRGVLKIFIEIFGKLNALL